MPDFDPTLTDRFESGRIAPADFGHHDHVQVAWEMLERYDFLEASTRYGQTIRRMAESVGALEKYNATITLAFMSIIAERRLHASHGGFAAFLAANPDLLEPNLLDRWYSRERLTSPLARAQFLMPDEPRAA